MKIGLSSRIDVRLRELKCSPADVIQLADCLTKERMKATEKVLHQRYDQWRFPQSEMFNLLAEQINECRLTLQAIKAKSIEARQAVHNDKVAEYERKAAEQAERKAAAERAKAQAEAERRRKAQELDRKLWPVENGRLREGASQRLRHKFIGTEKTVWRSFPKSKPKRLSKKDEWNI